MDPFTMAELLLGDTELTPGQLAQLRAINTKYFTELAALQGGAGAGERARAERALGVSRAAPAEAGLAALRARIASDIRDMLTEEQRAVFDRNVSRLQERESG